MRSIKFCVVHCSDSDIKSHDNVETIRKWHLARNFNDIGYHYIITKDGVAHKGRPIFVQGAHTKGYNKHSIGICLTGRDKFSRAQFDTLNELCDNLALEFGLERFDFLHHSDFNDKKTCPNFNLHDVFSKKERL